MNQALAPSDRIHLAVNLQTVLADGGGALERVVARLNRERSGPPLEVAVAQQVGPNAFTLPGGWVYVGSELANGVEAVTAFVVAHEMAHHDLGHVGALTGPTSMSDDGGAGTLRALASCTAHSLAQEIEADRQALELCHRAGFSESGAREAFVIFERVEREMRRRERRRRVPGAVTTLEILVAKLGIVRPDAPVAQRRRALWALPAMKKSLPTRYGLSSTRMTFVCSDCRARFGPQALCPRCGATAIYSLSEPMARERVLSSSMLLRTTQLGAVWWLIGAFICATFAILHVFGTVPTLIAAGLAAAGLGQGLGRDRALAPPTERLRAVPAAPQLPAGRTTRVAGRIRVIHAVTSPTGATCAVWQIRGRGSFGLLDDAGVGQFDIVDGGRVVGRVECDDALVDLGRNHLWRVRRVDEGLRDFLAARGGGGATRIRLAESILRDGDHVEVTGLTDDEVAVDGQRGNDLAPRFRDWPSIRRA